MTTSLDWLGEGEPPSLQATNVNGWGVLHHAAFTQSGLVLAAALAAGGDPKSATKQGLTPLHIAVLAGSAAAVPALLDANPMLLFAKDKVKRLLI